MDMESLSVLPVILALSCLLSGWTHAADTDTHTQLLHTILSAVEREVEKLEDQHTDRDICRNVLKWIRKCHTVEAKLLARGILVSLETVRDVEIFALQSSCFTLIGEADTENDKLERLAQILSHGMERKVANPKTLNTNSDQVNTDTRASEMSEEKKDTVKRLIVSLVKKTKHCGPLGLDEICADSHDCCCGYSCWKWRCRDKPKVVSNWWDDLHLP